MKAMASGRRTRRTHNPAVKARVALTVLREDKALAELCELFKLHPYRISNWKKLLLERAAQVFDCGPSPVPVNPAPPRAKIGQLAPENDFLQGGLTEAGLLSVKP